MTVTTLDSLTKAARPDSESEEEEEEEEEEEAVPGMSMKQKTGDTVVPVVIGIKEKKAIARTAVLQLHKTKAFK